MSWYEKHNVFRCSLCCGVVVLQVRSSDGHLEVNVDPLLIEVLSEIHYLSRPPLSVRLPVSLRQLVKAVDFKQLKHRKTSLEVSLHHLLCTTVPYIMRINSNLVMNVLA